jgi:hypothetical protein
MFARASICRTIYAEVLASNRRNQASISVIHKHKSPTIRTETDEIGYSTPVASLTPVAKAGMHEASGRQTHASVLKRFAYL